MTNFRFYWRDGKLDKLFGEDAADALNRAGYGAGALAALDFWSRDEGPQCTYNFLTREWDNPPEESNRNEQEAAQQ